MKRHLIFLTVLGGVAAVAVTAFVFQRPLGDHLYQQIAARQAGRDVVAELPNGLHVALCGTGSPMPDPTRAGPCNAVIAGGRVFMFDTGEGGVRNLARMGINAGRIEAVFLTHFHSDHIDGLGGLLLQRWVGGTHTSPLPIHGPEGVATVVAGFNQAYSLDFGYRTAHHGAGVAAPSGAGGTAITFNLAASNDPRGTLVYDRDGVVIRAFPVQHDPIDPAVGYRIEYAGRSLVLSGDTVQSERLTLAARGADLLIHEALQPRLLGHITQRLEQGDTPHVAQITRDILDYHATPEQAAETAQASGVKALVLNHVVPPQPVSFSYAAYLGDAPKAFDGPITVGEDGMMFSLLEGSDTIDRRNLF